MAIGLNISPTAAFSAGAALASDMFSSTGKPYTAHHPPRSSLSLLMDGSDQQLANANITSAIQDGAKANNMSVPGYMATHANTTAMGAPGLENAEAAKIRVAAIDDKNRLLKTPGANFNMSGPSSMTS